MLDNTRFIYMVCVLLHTGVCQVSSPELHVSICYDPGGNSLCFLVFYFFFLFSFFYNCSLKMGPMLHVVEEENGTARESVRQISYKQLLLPQKRKKKKMPWLLTTQLLKSETAHTHHCWIREHFTQE